MRQPSADPYNLLLGRGVKGDRTTKLEDIEPRDEQLWILEDSEGNVIDIQQYDIQLDSWESLLSDFVRFVSGISPNSDGEVEQVVEVEGPSPSSSDAREKQVGIDPVRSEVWWYLNGSWVLIGTKDTTEGATETHSLAPDTDQVIDPQSAPSTTINAGAGALDLGAYKWAITFTCPWGETLIGSSATAEVSVSSGDAVDLSNIPTASEDIAGIERNIYRTQVNGSSFYYLTTIADNSTTTYTDDGDVSVDTTNGTPSSNTTEAHIGNVDESDVDFNVDTGHNHDGSNSRIVVIPQHDINGDKHSGGLPWSELENIPTEFDASEHELNPGSGPHTGIMSWSNIDNPDLSSDPHGDEDHTEDYSKNPHDNTDHSETYLTDAVERIRYGAGQLGQMESRSNLQPPVPIDVSGTAVKAYVLARNAPSTNVSGTITITHPGTSSTVMEHNMTLPSGDIMNTDSSLSVDIPDESMIQFSLNDSDDSGIDFSIYLIVETSIGS